MKWINQLTLACVCGGLVACGGGGGPTPGSEPTPSPSPVPTPSPAPIISPTPAPVHTPSPTPVPTPSRSPSPTSSPAPAPVAFERVSNETCIAPADPAEPGDFSLTAIFDTSGFPELGGIVGLYQQPGNDDSWYALQRWGRIVRFDNSEAASTVDTFLQLNNVASSVELGMLGFAFHPNYQQNGYVYVNYNDEDNGNASTISRFTSIDGAAVDPSSEFVILTLDQPAANHNGGDIHFGPDGYLYIGFGDGGGANDTFGHGQNTESWHGTVLRIDVDNTSAGRNYAIPADNPFVSDSSVLPEIYAYGLRNPWRFSFDPETGDLWVADVGQDALEEINLVDPGDNLGWPIMEGKSCFQSSSCDQTGLTLPVVDYSHPGGNCAVSGGYVYRSTRIPGLYGSYIYGDYCSGNIWRAFQQGNEWQSELLVDAWFNVAAFGQGNDGEVYTLNIAGGSGASIFRLDEREGSGSSNIPSTLSATGCYASTEDKTYAAAVVPYEINSILWSDGAVKQRAFAIPDGSDIEVSDDGDFEFPVGSVLVKEFLDGDDYLETRLLMHHDRGWVGYSYEWLEDQTDAVLLDEGKTVDTGNFVHTYPSYGDCQSCHTPAAGFSLGLEDAQLNKDFTYPLSGVSTNQLDALHEAGVLETRSASGDIATLAGLSDISASIEQRARSYLHSNCSSCHRPNGPGVILDFRIQTALADTGACDEVPNAGSLGITDARVIALGDSERSVLLARMRSEGSERMPPLASLVEDTDATALIETWINELDSCD